MLVGVISDVHDDVENLETAIKKLNEEGIRVLIHCGDFCSPFSLKKLKEYEGEVHAVFGNNDGDVFALTKKSYESVKNVKLYGYFGELVLEKNKIAFLHDDKLARLVALSGKYDVVFYGHSHEFKVERVNKTLLVNPGSISRISERPSFVVYNTKNKSVKQYLL